MSSKDEEVRVKTRWRMTGEKLSSAWLRLVAKLTASRKEKTTGTDEAASDGGCNESSKMPKPPL